MMLDARLKKTLDKLMRDRRITAYSVDGNKILICVENEEDATTLKSFSFEGFEVEIRVTGRFMAL